MKLKAAAQWMLAILLMAPCMQAQSVWNTTHLANVKRSIREPFYATAYETLKKEADRLSDAQPLSVMMKEKTPASGDKHDYMSQARYFWPDPAKPDGLPYINRDGISNPELNKLDRNRLGTTANRITTLALAWYFSEEEKYARKATELIRVWFLDKATRMNPNLEYAQMIPGHNNDKGRCYGLIDTYSFIEMLDAVALLEQSKAFTAKDSKQLKKWFAELTDWMLTSPQGKEEAAGANNHSVAYDAQIIAFALYTGNKKLAQEGRYFRRKTYLPTDSPRRTATVRTTAYPCLPLFTVQPDSFHRHHADGKDTRNPYRQCHFRRWTKLLQSYGFPGILRREKPQRMALPTNKRLGRLRAEFLQRPLPNGCLPESCTQGLSAPLSCPPHLESS